MKVYKHGCVEDDGQNPGAYGDDGSVDVITPVFVVKNKKRDHQGVQKIDILARLHTLQQAVQHNKAVTS